MATRSNTGQGGTTDRDHGGGSSHRPRGWDDAHGGDARDHTATANEDGQGPGDERHGAVSPQVRSDSDGTLPDSGFDRDAGAGASAGHDRGGAEASRNAQRSGAGGKPGSQR
jgi:hypothetical protein